MKVTFILASMWGTRLDAMYTGHACAPEKRTVTIELTNDQIKQLNIQQIGMDGNMPRYEEVAECFVEKEFEHESLI